MIVGCRFNGSRLVERNLPQDWAETGNELRKEIGGTVKTLIKLG
jgi:hypothetical protein